MKTPHVLDNVVLTFEAVSTNAFAARNRTIQKALDVQVNGITVSVEIVLRLKGP